MQQQNPYESPQVSTAFTGNSNNGLVVTPVALAALIKTKKWVMIVGVVAFITVGLYLINQVFSWSQTHSGISGTAKTMVLTSSIIGLVIMALYTLLAFKLVQYSRWIGRLEKSNHPADLENALDVQTKFWSLAGIIVLVTILMMIAMIFISLIATF